MIPRVATVLSARPWEGRFVALARETAVVRLVLRAYRPEDVDDRSDEIDVIVAGAETAWVTPARIASWRRRGLGVIGVFPSGDDPARHQLEIGGAHEVVADDVAVPELLSAARVLVPSPPESESATGTVVGVTGARGAPGRTEIALALAESWSRSRRICLLDLDIEAPGLAIRLGLSPRPDITDVADAVRAGTGIPTDATHDVGGLRVVVGSHRPGEPPVRESLVEDVIEGALGSFEIVVADLGPFLPDDRLLKRSDHAVLVVEASASGLVRAARAAAEWSGPPPLLILNRASGDREEIVRAARRWTGLEPAAVIADHGAIRRSARTTGRPHRRLRRAVRTLGPPA